MSAVRKTTPARPKKRVANTAARGLTEALAEASWREADRALAQAMAELDELEAASNAAEMAAAAMLLGQSLTRAARRRGLARFGLIGRIEAYDARRHELIRKPIRPPGSVRIVAQGIARAGLVLVKARATPTPAARKKRS
jgi:folylpolyglutamate synthase/dihydropteroate synthase